jgi:hypothetical protein
MNNHRLFRPLVALAASLVLLAGCGGGGGGNSGPRRIPATTELGNSYQYEEGFAGCSIETQKKFVRSYMDEVYLWYDQIPEVDPARYTDIRNYFHALRVPQDNFSTAIDPRTPVQPELSQPQQALAPDANLKADPDAVRDPQLVTTPGGRKLAYLWFRDHDVGAQDELIDAFRKIQSMGTQDLVLDLRENSGGYLYIALTAASMIASPARNGQVFEQLQYNAKRPEDTADGTYRYSGLVQYGETLYPVGTPLPQLALPRVFVLTTGATCSASESIINGLRGIDVPVITIGSRTCGKPYGFREKTNCGVSYFAIEFKGSNAKGFGDYTSGFEPTCSVANSGTPGGSDDSLLNAAKTYVDTGSCPAAPAQSAGKPLLGTTEQPNRPSWTGRLLLPQQQAR